MSGPYYDPNNEEYGHEYNSPTNLDKNKEACINAILNELKGKPQIPFKKQYER